MSTVTIPKKEYQKLVETRLRYEYLRRAIEEDLFVSPPTKKIGGIVAEFSAVKKYSRAFLRDLERGLRRSSYFRS